MPGGEVRDVEIELDHIIVIKIILGVLKYAKLERLRPCQQGREDSWGRRVGTGMAETGGTKTTAETGGTAKTAGGGTGWTGKPMDWETSESYVDQTSSCIKGRSSKVEAPNKDTTN